MICDTQERRQVEDKSDKDAGAAATEATATQEIRPPGVLCARVRLLMLALALSVDEPEKTEFGAFPRQSKTLLPLPAAVDEKLESRLISLISKGAAEPVPVPVRVLVFCQTAWRSWSRSWSVIGIG